MTSQIDASKPGEGSAFTADVRDNFATARDEITDLQAQVAGLQASVQGLTDALELATAAITTLNTDVAGLTSDVTTLQDQVANLSATLEVAGEEITVLNNRQQAAASMITVDPPNTNSLSFVMAGIQVVFSPDSSSRGVLVLEGQLGNTNNGGGAEAQLVIGTGNPPAFGTAFSATNGQLIGAPASILAAKPNDNTPFAVTALLTGLTHQDYWIGCAFRSVGSGSATLSAMQLIAFELLDPVPAVSAT